jgi:hypothetical protein
MVGGLIIGVILYIICFFLNIPRKLRLWAENYNRGELNSQVDKKTISSTINFQPQVMNNDGNFVDTMVEEEYEDKFEDTDTIEFSKDIKVNIDIDDVVLGDEFKSVLDKSETIVEDMSTDPSDYFTTQTDDIEEKE